MSAFAYRYVGREALPARSTEFDLRQFFQLTSADIAAIRARFRADRHAAVGLQLVCLRAFGRPLDRFAAVPRNLLRYLCDAFSAPTLSIGSLKTLYQRRPTLQIMQAFSSYVDVPEEHLTDHSALPAAAQSAAEMQQTVRIRSGKERPTNAYAAVRYRDYWFWIDQGDLRTKRALNAVMLFFTMTDTGAQEALPLITIPAQ